MATPRPPVTDGGDAQLIDRQGFWSLVVAVPVLLSVLRLWAEAGGDLQTTLLLVANVGAVNLFAALVVHGAWLVSAVLVAVFTIGSVTDPYADPAAAPPERAPRLSLFCWLSSHAPLWLKFSVFALAALTWQLLYTPLLILAFLATFRDQLPQTSPGPSSHREATSPRSMQALQIVGLVAYIALFGPTAVEAAEERYVVPVMLIVVTPVLLVLGAYHPVPGRLTRPFALAAQTGTVVFALVAGTPVIAAPVLPLTVLTVEADDGQSELVRGHVVEVNDNTTAILREAGGVDFIPNGDVKARILCPDRDQAPQYRLWIYGIHVEDNLLQGIGRNRHPRVTIDPRCRPAVPERHVDES